MISADDIQEPTLRRIFLIWDERRGGKPMPTRAEMDLPFSIHFGLPYASLFDIDSDKDPTQPSRYRYRLVGTEIVANMGRDVTGEYVDEVLEGAFRDQVLAWFRQVIDSGQPLYHETRYPWRSIRRYSRLSLPLGEHGVVQQLLNCAMFVHESSEHESYFDSLKNPTGPD